MILRYLAGACRLHDPRHLDAKHAECHIQQRDLAFEVLHFRLRAMDVAGTARERSDHGARVRGIDVGDAVSSIMIDEIDELEKIGRPTGPTLDQAAGQAEVFFQHKEGFERRRTGLNMCAEQRIRHE